MWDLAFEAELWLRVLFAGICGIAVGLERGFRRKEAGQRTHCVMAVGACAFTILSVYGFSDHAGAADLTQIACQIVCGVGFLGVGIIYKDPRNGISGLSTATGIWTTAAIGMTCGLGMYALAGCTSLGLVLLHVFLNLTRLDDVGYTVQEIRLEVTDPEGLIQYLRKKKRRYGIQILSSEYTRHERGTTVRFIFRMKGEFPIKEVLTFLREHPEIREISL